MAFGSHYVFSLNTTWPKIMFCLTVKNDTQLGIEHQTNVGGEICVWSL
jgi:hypothetical protein